MGLGGRCQWELDAFYQMVECPSQPSREGWGSLNCACGKSGPTSHRAYKFSIRACCEWATIIADAAGARTMRLFRKKLSKQDEKVLAEASDLAVRKLEQYFADRRNLPPVTRDAPKKSALTRLRWW